MDFRDKHKRNIPYIECDVQFNKMFSGQQLRKVVERRENQSLEQCFSTAGPRPGTGPWHQL